MVEYFQLSSLEKVMMNDEKPKKEFTEMSAMNNERVSYQIAFRQFIDGAKEALYAACEVTVKSPLERFITLRTVEYIPSMYPVNPAQVDDDFISTEPGFYPDLLRPLEKPFVEAFLNTWQSLFVTVDLDGSVPAGIYPVDITFKNKDDVVVKHMQIEVVGAALPEQKTVFTQWFHTDCIAKVYNVRMFSEKHWQLIESFIKTAVRNGINMLLTPIFTPPLDTRIGGERPTVQLVDVTLDENGYSFDFSKLHRWFEVAKRCGVRYFEMSHLFSQWGLKATPKIVVRKGGKLKKLFGWHVNALSEEYKEFLAVFLPQLTAFLKAEGVAEQTVFHISDEPHGEEALQRYLAAKEFVQPYVKGFKIIDALSQVEYYNSGAVQNPVPSTGKIKDFLATDIKEHWAYYCCSTRQGLANRFYAMPSYRNRAIGLQLYKYDIKGFLHWGYNFYYSRESTEVINPFLVTDAKHGFPSGDSFSVYPGTDGAWESLRLVVFYDALQDIRALQLLESLVGKEKTMAIVEKAVGEEITFDDYVHSADKLLAMREAVNAEIKSNI